MIGELVAAAAGLSAAYTVGGHLLGHASALKRRADLPDSIALTFDDGPDPETTPAILGCLAEHEAPATFFMVGERVSKHGSLVRRIAEGGHELGSHTYSHRHLWTAGPWATAREMTEATEAIADAAGQPPLAFRPPWGVFNAAALAVARRLQQPSVLWSVRSEGLIWKPSPAEMAEHIAARVRGGDIINLHDAGGFPDTPARVLAALPDVIRRLRDAGFRLVGLSAMLRARTVD